MPDVVIRGMEMPKSCDECRLFNESWCMALSVENWRKSYNKPPEGGRLPDCPLVPLPEGHGDLVERKALNLFPDYKDVRNRIKQTIKATERDGRNITGVTIDLLKQTLVALDSLRSVRRYFLNAKTIVPAEGGTDDV